MKLIYNKTNTVPHFIVPGITPETKVSAAIFSVNRQGKSEPVTLESIIERAVGSRRGRLNSYLYKSETLIVLIVCGIVGFLLAIVVLLLVKKTCFSESENELHISTNPGKCKPNVLPLNSSQIHLSQQDIGKPAYSPSQF
ncbi:uncharacterized protein LOC136029034 [Artemia franciscana]